MTLQGEKRSKEHETNEEKVPSIYYFTLFRFASTWDTFLIIIAIVASVAAGATLPYSITLVANLFQTMINYDKDIKKGIKGDKEFLVSMYEFGINYALVGVILFTCGYLGSALMNLTAINQVYKIRKEYLTAVLNQDCAFFDVHKTGHFASRMTEDMIKLEEGIGDKLSTFLYSLTTAIGCITLAFFKGWKLALLCLISTPVTFLLVGVTGRIADRLYKKEAIEKGLASAIAQEVLSSIRTVYAFNGQRKELKRYQEKLIKATEIFVKKEFFIGLSMGFLFFCVFCSYALSFYFGIYLIVNDPQNYNADVMFAVFFGVMTALGNFGTAGVLVRSFGVACGAGAQIFSVLDNVPTINPLLNSGIVPRQAEGTIELNNVFFEYPSRPNVSVLKGVSLNVKRGQRVALVGHSGCGKSTIIQLISRYYDVTNGSVSVDGVDVRKLSVRWLRSTIGLVRQEPVLFNTTIRENIRYGRQSATDEEIEAAAEQANAHQFILKLPKSYETLVGQSGTSLSGGQKQRIAIARALIRNPAILLLDEATSALDVASEAKVQMALNKASENRTTVIVAHRLSTIRHVDLIYVMRAGTVVESGSHEQLMTLHGHYYDMVALQEPHMVSSEAHPVVTQQESIASEYEAAELIPKVEEEEQAEVPHVSFWTVLALNAQECKWLVIGSVASVIIGFSMPLFILIFGDLFGSMSDPDPNKLMQKVNSVSALCVFIGVAIGVATLTESISFGKSGSQLLLRLQLRMFTHMLAQHVGFFDERANSTGALCAKLSSEASYVQGGSGQRIGIVLQGIGSIGLAFTLAMVYEWRVAMVALAFLPLVVFVVYQEIKATRAESYGNAKSLENSTKVAVETVTNVRTVVSLGREKLFVIEYVDQLTPALDTATKAARYKGIVNGLSKSMFNFINAVALTYGGHLIVNDRVPYQNILITTQSLQMASGQAQNAFMYTPQFQKAIAAASRIMALLNTKPKIQDPDTPAVRPFKSKGEATFQAVEFRYPTRPNIKILRGLDLQVNGGKTIALVGHSGCGKSTVIQLLQRFYDPENGVVSLDNIPLKDIIITEARSSFGLVSQEPTLFDYSIADNIAYGDLESSPTQEEIEAAAKQANIHGFIVSLPEGYQTNIGPKGMQLSGGQKQRVAIARALVRQPKILLLDEATSALDTESEKAVQEALDTAMSGRTCVIIAHRLSTVRDSDVIAVLSAGRVAESGTHQQLLDAKGIYYKLYST